MRRGRTLVAVVLLAAGLGWVTARGLSGSLVYYQTPSDLVFGNRPPPPLVSVVVPVYNEEANLPELLRRVTSVLDAAGDPYDVILVDDGSRDETPQILGRLSDGITITTFMIATDSYLVDFVDKLTKINRGRAYYASPYNLAEFLFTDYIRNRKKFLH